MKILVLDFETEPISDVPDGKAPKPVGMALSAPGLKPRYWSWGHADGNNTTFDTARIILQRMSVECDTLICHNIGFDAEVARQHMGVDMSAMQWHDTQVMAFHNDPHSPSLGLKQLAARYLGMPPDEQNDVRDWLRGHRIIRSNTKEIGPYLYLAPGKLVGKYAVGDVVRTRRLFDRWRPVYANDEGYCRDMKATRVGLKMTRRGVVIDTKLLDIYIDKAEHHVAKAKARIARELGISQFDPNDRETTADAIEHKYGIALPLTPTGRRQTNKDALFDALPDGPGKALIRYVGAIDYDLKNYLRPWKAATQATGGLIHPHWSVTRSDVGGARTGRLSSSPNFQNLRGVEGTENLVAQLVKWFGSWHYWTPMIRGLVVPPDDRIIVGRDWSQIELRLTAHYEDGPMAENYRAKPDWDLHQWVIDRVKELFGVELIRRIAKNIGFGVIYGAGIAPLVKQARISWDEAEQFKSLYLRALPSLKDLMDEVQAIGRARAIMTLGGRVYKAETPRFNPALGRMQEYYYKLLNYLIQGSAADLMKEAMNDADDYGIELFLTVHDEPVALANLNEAEDMLEGLRVAMEHNDLVSRVTVPIISNGYTAQRWSEAEK